MTVLNMWMRSRLLLKVFPDLKNADLQKVYGVLEDVKLLKKMLYTNEYNALVEAVQDLSGMDDDFDDLKNDAKNE